jgi:hypothetical protein
VPVSRAVLHFTSCDLSNIRTNKHPLACRVPAKCVEEYGKTEAPTVTFEERACCHSFSTAVNPFLIRVNAIFIPINS